MQESTTSLAVLLGSLTARARSLGLTNTDWAARAGVRKETLSRLHKRQTCDLATLAALAAAVGGRIAVVADGARDVAPGGHFPRDMSREYEEALLSLCASRSRDVQQWREAGPPFFMAGIAVMLASTAGFDRRGMLALAEELHPGASEPAAFARWLAESPLKPSRFLPQLDALIVHAA